jgi:hypothetical protein
MAIARVQSVHSQQSNVTTATYVMPSNVAAGALIVLAVAWYRGDTLTPPVPTDTRSNTYVEVASSGFVNDVTVRIYAAYNSTAGACTLSHTAPFSGLYTGGAAIEYSGALTASAFDVGTGANAPSGSPTNAPATGSTATTSQANEMVICIGSTYNSLNPIGFASPANTGYSSIANNQDGDSGMPYVIGDKIITTTGTQSADWGTLSGNQNWVAAIATFKAIEKIPARLAMMGVGR